VLANNRLALAGSVAALRGTLLSAERGVIPADVAFRGRPTARRIIEAVASDILRRTSTLIAEALKPDEARIADAERLARQLVSVAILKGLFRTISHEGDHTAYLKAIWHSLSIDNEIGAGAANLLALVGPNDSLMIIDRILTSLASNGRVLRP